MKKYKILNLYACLGGNRYKWDEVADSLDITAVELDPVLAKMYKQRFPDDTVIVGDAHEYLLNNYSEFDFIWASPPCPTHSKARFWGVGANGKDPKYPDMKLYQEIILLSTHYKGKYCIENVVPYYAHFIPAHKRGRHLYWTNFRLPSIISTRSDPGVCRGKNEIEKLSNFHEFNFRNYKGNQKLNKIARNLVDYEAGKTILETALNVHRDHNKEQLKLF